MTTGECHLCLGAHDGAYHESVRRLRRWMIRKIDLASAPPPVAQRRVQPFPGMGDIHSLRSPSAKRRKAARK
jgi:hypothetical protein